MRACSPSLLLLSRRGSCPGARPSRGELVGQHRQPRRAARAACHAAPRRRLAAHRRIPAAADDDAALPRGRAQPAAGRHHAEGGHHRHPLRPARDRRAARHLARRRRSRARATARAARSASASSSARNSRRWTPTARRCAARRATGATPPSLGYAVEAGRLKSFEWRSKLAPSGHTLHPRQPGAAAVRRRPAFAPARCTRHAARARRVRDGRGGKLRRRLCGSQAYLEPLLVDRRGHCRLLRPEAR